MTIQLRQYQKEALEKIKWSMDTLDGNDLVVLPTGAGKSIVISELANYLNQDILILQPTKEILEQNKRKLSQYVDESEIGVFSASLGEKIIKKYTFATIGSVYKIPEQFSHFKIILLDECHLLNPKDTGSMFGQFLKGMGNPKVIGFTATPYRIFPTYFMEYDQWGGRGLYRANSIKILSRVKPFFWSRIIYNINSIDLLNQGYLCPLEYVDKTKIKQELIPLNKTQTDFDLEKYDKMINKIDVDIVSMINEVKTKHKSILVFCTSIAQSQRMLRYFPESQSISSQTKPKERDSIITGFKDGSIKIVFNVGVLTTGFDMPELDCIVLLRPTRSVALYYQMLGRGVRIAPNKAKCTIYDWTDSVNRIGTIESIKMEKVDGKWNVVSSGMPEGWNAVQLYSFKVKSL